MTTIALASKNDVDINAVIRDTQILSQKADKITLLWWVPEEFWQISYSQNPNITEEAVKKVLESIRPYTIIVVLDGEVGIFGGITYFSEKAIRSEIKIKDKKGNSYNPIDDNKIDINTKNFLLMMKPIFINMLGPMGQNIHFILFPAKDQNGNQIVEATKDGMFLVEFKNKEYKWRLPLGSLILAKVCPTCGEKLSGSYKYCPWDASRLIDYKK